MTESARIHDVAVLRIDKDSADVFGVGKSDCVPVVAAIARTIDSGADRDAVAHPGFARPHPNRLRIGRIDGYRANRERGLLVKNRLESYAAIHRLPHAAAGRADVNSEPLAFMNSCYVGDAASHGRRAYGADRKSAKRVRVERHILPRGGHCERGQSDDRDNPEDSHAIEHVPSN